MCVCVCVWEGVFVCVCLCATECTLSVSMSAREGCQLLVLMDEITASPTSIYITLQVSIVLFVFLRHVNEYDKFDRESH